jgi:ornithine carbamoyltransferase
MGQEEEREARLRAFEGFTLDDDLVLLAADDAVVLHCLPAHRGEEISASVFEGPRSVVWRQAAHRRTAMRGVLAWAVGGAGRGDGGGGGGGSRGAPSGGGAG